MPTSHASDATSTLHLANALMRCVGCRFIAIIVGLLGSAALMNLAVPAEAALGLARTPIGTAIAIAYGLSALIAARAIWLLRPSSAVAFAAWGLVAILAMAYYGFAILPGVLSRFGLRLNETQVWGTLLMSAILLSIGFWYLRSSLADRARTLR